MRALHIATATRVLLALPLVGGTGCTVFIAGELDKIAANLAAEGEGEGEEGEGEGEEGEGEEGEGEEGEGEGDDDPACELEERLVVAREDDEKTDVLHVYSFEPGRFVRIRPVDQPGNVNLENDEPGGDVAGGAFAFGLGSAGRFYLGGGNFLYQLDRATLTQESITGRTALRVGTSIHAVHVIGGHILAIGDSVFDVEEGAAVGTPAVELATTDDFHRAVKFSVRNTAGLNEDFVAAVGRFGYAIFSSVDGAAPALSVSYDEDFNENRFHDFVGGTFQPRGIAFDTTTKQLLLGDIGRVIVLNHSNGFSIQPDDNSTDFVVPVANQFDEPRVVAIAARGGFAWVLLDRSVDNLFRLDLSTSPPTATQVTTVDTSSFGRSLAVGCKRLIVSDFQGVFALERETLEPITQLTIPDIEQISIIKRADLALAGDD